MMASSERDHRQQGRGNAVPWLTQRLQAKLEELGEAERIGDEHRPPRAPACEDHERDGDPAGRADRIVLPRRHDLEGEVRTGEPGEGPSHQHMGVPDPGDVDAGCLGAGGILADRPKRQADLGVEQVEAGGRLPRATPT